MNNKIATTAVIAGGIALLAILLEPVAIELADTFYAIAGLIWYGLSLYALIELLTGKGE
jgi:hypothetical protein